MNFKTKKLDFGSTTNRTQKRVIKGIYSQEDSEEELRKLRTAESLREEPMNVKFLSKNLDYYKKNLEDEISVPSMENMSQLFYQSMEKNSGSSESSFGTGSGVIKSKKDLDIESSNLSRYGSENMVDEFIPNELKMG